MQRILIVAAVLGGVCFAVLQIGMHWRANLTNEFADVKQLEWQDLVPPAEPLADALSDAPINIRFDLGFIGKVIADANAELISREAPEYLNAMALLEKHRAWLCSTIADGGAWCNRVFVSAFCRRMHPCATTSTESDRTRAIRICL